MKRNKLQQALKRIKTHTPRWFWTRCHVCDAEYKRESMFYFKQWSDGPHTIRYKVWNCTECCATMADVIKKNHQYFGKVDVSPLREESWNDF